MVSIFIAAIFFLSVSLILHPSAPYNFMFFFKSVTYIIYFPLEISLLPQIKFDILQLFSIDRFCIQLFVNSFFIINFYLDIYYAYSYLILCYYLDLSLSIFILHTGIWSCLCSCKIPISHSLP